MSKIKTMLLSALAFIITVAGIFFAGKKSGKQEAKNESLEKGVEDAIESNKRFHEKTNASKHITISNLRRKLMRNDKGD